MITSFRDIGASFETSAESRVFAAICALLTMFFVGFFTTGLFLGHRQFDTVTSATASITPAQRLAARAAAAVGLKPASFGLLPASEASARNTPVVTRPPDAVPSRPAALPAKSAVAPASANVATAASDSGADLSGPIVVQVAAVANRQAAEELAKALKGKQFAAFVLAPTVDAFYRVQTGPYANAAIAKAVRTQLEGQGYQPILKHR
jgi:cell division septation protein DedD